MAVEWRNAGPPLADHILSGAELLLGVEFPSEYRACVRVYHGGRPEPNRFRVNGTSGEWASCVGVLLSLAPRAAEGMWVTLAGLSREAGLPDGLIPVADDGGGDYVCLDYRAGPHGPKVVYWSHEVGGEDGITPVADTFATFLKLLGDQPEHTQ